MAMVLPFLLTLIFLFVQVGHGYLTAHMVKDVGRRACRLAACHGQSTQSVCDYAQQLLTRRGVKDMSVSVLVNQQTTDLKDAKPGDWITIRINDSAAGNSTNTWTGFLGFNRAASTSSVRRE